MHDTAISNGRFNVTCITRTWITYKNLGGHYATINIKKDYAFTITCLKRRLVPTKVLLEHSPKQSSTKQRLIRTDSHLP